VSRGVTSVWGPCRALGGSHTPAGRARGVATTSDGVPDHDSHVLAVLGDGRRVGQRAHEPAIKARAAVERPAVVGRRDYDGAHQDRAQEPARGVKVLGLDLGLAQ
jgi:hypothetical protein